MDTGKKGGRPGLWVRYLLNGRVFKSMSEASLETGIPVATVYRHCHGRVRPKFRKFEMFTEE